MTITAKCLFEAAFAPSSAGIVYIAPSSTTTIIDKFTATNVTGSAATLTVCIVPFTSSASSSNTIVSSFSVAGNTTQDFSSLQNQILNAGDFISITAGTASALVTRGSGREIQ